jgi:hypothetical protein
VTARPEVPRLTVELVPSTAWGSNVRSRVRPSVWDRLRRAAYAAAGHRCECCQATGRLEAHEVWAYDDAGRVQRLLRLLALCPRCYLVKHYGRARVTGQEADALAQLCRVNGWTEAQAFAYVAEAFEVWRRRSAAPWTVDLSVLGLPPDAFRPVEQVTWEAQALPPGRPEKKRQSGHPQAALEKSALTEMHDAGVTSGRRDVETSRYGHRLPDRGQYRWARGTALDGDRRLRQAEGLDLARELAEQAWAEVQVYRGRAKRGLPPRPA